jgi:chromosome segregation ATPase
MDSVIGMEGGILRTSGESPLSKKDQIKRNIESYKIILQQQRERLDVLEKKLKDSNAYAGKMQKTLAALKQQLEEKDQAIATLSTELELRNFEVDELKKNVDNLNIQVSELVEDTRSKSDSIDKQDAQLHEAFVFIGSKKELKAAGLAQGGTLFKKLKIEASNVDKKIFQKIDIRNSKRFTIPDDDAEVLTQMPADSYKITKTGDDSSELIITDPAQFWSVTRVLVIRY